MPPDVAATSPALPGPRVLNLRSTPPAGLDRLIFEIDDWWSEPVERQAQRRREFIAEAVARHLEACPAYARLATMLEFDLSLLSRDDGLAWVPQFPTLLFKRTEVASVPAAACQVFFSSGTRGAVSRIQRDDTTLRRLAGSLRPESDIWCGLHGMDDLDDDGLMLHLGPPRSEAAGVWIGYVMTLIELFTATRSYVRDGELRMADVIRDLRAAVAEGRVVCVAGPPVFVAALLRALRHSGTRIDAGERMLVATGGGWKRDERAKVRPEALRGAAVEALGLRDDSQVRDVFNQVELNTAFVECAHHRLHVPPWVEVIVRDPHDLSAVAEGDVGLLSYLDPSATSYPCFILGEDIGRISTGECSCGRCGVTVEIGRRLLASDHQGCALRLADTTRIAAP